MRREAAEVVEVPELLGTYDVREGSVTTTSNLEQRRANYFRIIERAFERRDSSWLVDVGLDPRFELMRNDPGFRDLLRRMSLPS